MLVTCIRAPRHLEFDAGDQISVEIGLDAFNGRKSACEPLLSTASEAQVTVESQGIKMLPNAGGYSKGTIRIERQATREETPSR